jgi:hypothetical protein
LEAEHQRLVAELDDERRALHVLRAEWANLNDPIRIQALAERYLAMQPMRPGQVTSVSGVQDIPYRQAAQPEQGEGTNETP